jgi:hypothetical protein
MKVVFLDIDGVLNHEEFYTKRNTIPLDEQKPYPYNHFDPISVAYLNDIIAVTNAKIVISSSWRSDPDIKNILHNVGIVGEIIGCTPDLYNIHGSLCRGKEIDAWLNCHPLVTEYVILDDDNDMEEHQLSHFIRTNPYGDGLNRKCRNDAIEILLRKNKQYF